MRLGRVHLFVAFAFTVMADPVSSVAYAIEAALRALHGDPASLFAAMALVVGIIVVVSLTYHQLIGRFPEGGGGPEAVAAAFGEGWAFLPLGALLVDFTLTVAVSCSAGAAALIAYLPSLGAARLPIALALAAVVAAGVLAGHRGRVLFALATQAFVLLALAVIVAGAFAAPLAVPAPGGGAHGNPLLAGATLAAVLAAFPLGMALATGVEAPSNAIAQLPQLGDRGRRLFGRGTLWLMVAIVGLLTLCFAALAVRLGRRPSRRRLDAARRGGAGLGRRRRRLRLLPGAQRPAPAGRRRFLIPGGLGRPQGARRPRPRRRERHAARAPAPRKPLPRRPLGRAGGARRRRGDDRRGRRAGAAARPVLRRLGLRQLPRRDPGLRASDSLRDRRPAAVAVNFAGAALVALVLVLNLTRLDSAIALIASFALAAYLWRAWVARGRPGGVVRAPAG